MTYTETCTTMAELGRHKVATATRTPGAFFSGAMLAGAYIGIALILALTVSAGLPAGVRPLVTGATFGLGLLLVVLAGAELFTGAVMYVTFGLARGNMTWSSALLMLVEVWIGNLVGSAIVAGLFAAGGGGAIFAAPPAYLHDYVTHKIAADVVALLARATLCNWLVCLAIWTAARIQNEAAKIIAMAWCLLAFVACGFEHSVANMTAFSLGLFDPSQVGDAVGIVRNLAIVTLGNIIGGSVFVAGAYLWAARGEAAPTQPN